MCPRVVLALHVLPPAFDPWSLELSTALYSYVSFSHLLHRGLIMVHLLDTAYLLYFTLRSTEHLTYHCFNNTCRNLSCSAQYLQVQESALGNHSLEECLLIRKKPEENSKKRVMDKKKRKDGIATVGNGPVNNGQVREKLLAKLKGIICPP